MWRIERKVFATDFDGWVLAGYAGVAGFLAMERFVRRPGTASSMNASDEDEGTTRLLVTASGVAAGLPLLLRASAVQLPRGQLPWGVAPIGLALIGSGLALRVWSMSTLGAYYTRTLRTEQDQHIIDTGPYRMVRHPGYAGALLIWTGFSLASRSALATATVSGLMGWAYQRRISVEERLLQRDLPGYRTYSRRTKRVTPFVW